MTLPTPPPEPDGTPEATPQADPAGAPKGEAKKGKRKEPNPWKLFGLGFEFAGVVAVLTFGGWWLDGKLGTTPWIMLTGLIIGGVGGLYNLWKIGKQYF